MPTGICVECDNEKDKIHFGTNEWKRKATGVLGSRKSRAMNERAW